MSESGDDRRRNERVEVDLWVEERTEDALYYQRATNLSVGGLFLDHTLPHPAGTRITLELRLPDDSAPMRLRGEVVEAPREQGMGVKFVDMPEEDRARIAEFLAKRPASRPPPPPSNQ